MQRLTLEQRVAALEKEMAEVRAQYPNGSKDKPWVSTMGLFAGDEGMKEIFDEALKIRAKDRRNARRRPGKKPATQRAKQ